MDANSRVLRVESSQEDVSVLAKNKYVLQIAKGIIKDEKLDFNLIWHSSILAPNTQFKWKPIYGLNWTLDVPTAGQPLTLMGPWEQCNLGQALELDKTGMWVQSTAVPTTNHINVGLNNFKSGTDSNGVHIVIGVQSPGQGFGPIYIDENELGYKGSASYQPQEKVQLWYETGMRSSTMMSNNTGGRLPKVLVDLTQPDVSTGTYTKTYSYDYSEGEWSLKSSQA